MDTTLVQNINIHYRKRTIHNYLRNLPNKKRWHPMIDSDDILLIVIKDDNILKLQGLLEHKDFTNKLATKIAHAMLIYVSNKHN
jgi:hypothetical protein